MDKVIIVIPAYNPLQFIVQFIEKLVVLQPKRIVIVNDGSNPRYISIFKKLAQFQEVHIISYEHNMGKGYAIKSALQYIVTSEKNYSGILTVGADNQHKIEDIEKIIETKDLFSDGLIIGVRQFRHNDLPIKNFLGNRAASILFELLFRKRLLDIQSGLRYIPKEAVVWVRKVPGQRFNFDTNMLIEAIHRKIPIYEVPIGDAKMSKNSFMYYDEILSAKLMLKQIWQSYIKNNRTR